MLLMRKRQMNFRASFYYFIPTIIAIVMCGYSTLGGYGRPEAYITSMFVKGDVVTQEEIDSEGESEDIYSFKPNYSKDASVEKTVTYSLYSLIILSFSINMMILGAVQKKNSW